MRLRVTALPTFLVTMTPTFGLPADFAGGEKACTVKMGADAQAPRRMVVANSRRPRRLTYGRIAAYGQSGVRRLRPLRRRDARTRRPFFVDIRLRNPCVRLRRLLC